MKTYSITMTVAVNVTIEANSLNESKELAMNQPLSNVSEFDRKIDKVEDITPVNNKPKPRRGIGSY